MLRVFFFAFVSLTTFLEMVRLKIFFFFSFCCGEKLIVLIVETTSGAASCAARAGAASRKDADRFGSGHSIVQNQSSRRR